MTQSNNSLREHDEILRLIPWEERIADHNNKIDEYLRNCIFRGYSKDTSIKKIKSALNRIFKRVEIDDPTHEKGRRQLLYWEIMHPELGPSRRGLIITSLLQDNLAPDTQRQYMIHLQNFCDYVVAKPNLAGNAHVMVDEKYGPIRSTFTKYDLPIHCQDRPCKPRYALSMPLRDEFYEFLRTIYLPGHGVPYVAARNYTIVILKAETGARISEVLGIRESCDIDWVKGRIRVFGKGKPGSGKRIRWINLSPLSIEVLRVFETVFRPMFQGASGADYLFTNEAGTQFKSNAFWKSFKAMVRKAREAGVDVPLDLKPHDLRRTYATIELEKNPLGYRKLLKQLGHTYPSSVAPYLVATDDDVEEAQADILDLFLDPHMNKQGVSACQ